MNNDKRELFIKEQDYILKNQLRNLGKSDSEIEEMLKVTYRPSNEIIDKYMEYVEKKNNFMYNVKPKTLFLSDDKAQELKKYITESGFEVMLFFDWNGIRFNFDNLDDKDGILLAIDIWVKLEGEKK